MDSVDFLLKEAPRLFVLNNLTSGSVSSAYGTFIVLAISFGIAAIGGLLYYGLLSMASGGSGYGHNSYSYDRYGRCCPIVILLLFSIISDLRKLTMTGGQ